MPSSGRLETSSEYNGSIDMNEFFVNTPHGLQRLVLSQERMARNQAAVKEYAVQSTFGFRTFASGVVQEPGKCVFVGTDSAFRENSQDCQHWELGQPEPPKFKRHLVLHQPGDDPKH
jgi:hypothetical protein